jgi:hypothetical protein
MSTILPACTRMNGETTHEYDSHFLTGVDWIESGFVQQITCIDSVALIYSNVVRLRIQGKN